MSAAPTGDGAGPRTGGRELGALLRAYRERAMLTQEQLAARTGLSARTIRRIESEALKRPRRDSVRLLAEALGLDPVERAELIATGRDGTAANATPRETATGPTGSTVPRQLPAGVPLFVGRTRELRLLDALLDGGSQPGSAVVISAIRGTPGVGKTSLALHWAHRAAPSFSDGQLYVNLRGFDSSGPPTAPADALRGFLEALGVPPQRIPGDLDARAALYRSLLAGRRILVLLDNAGDAAQVRPMLPGSPGCLVMITSRNQLPGLVAAEGAHPLTLDLLSADEAGELLVRRLGAARLAAEPDAVDEIVARCAGLPLALAIVAARAASYPDLALATLTTELRDTTGGLDAFAAGDPATDVRAVFSWSYRTLDLPAARLFRLLGLHPGPDIAAPAAAALAGVTTRGVRPLLAELVRAQLVVEHRPGRYAFHDLLRAYAIELAEAGDPASDRRAALHRVLDHYLRTANAAALLLHPHRDVVDLPPAQPAVEAELITDPARALDWFAAEHRVLLATIERAATDGFDLHAWQLAWSFWEYLDRRGHWHDWVDTQHTAVAAARRIADSRGEAHANRSLGLAYLQLGALEEADDHFWSALDRYGELGDRAGQARIHHNLCGVLEQQARYVDALDHAHRALELFRSAGHEQGQANALNGVGWFYTHLGRHDDAIDNCRQALVLLEKIGDRRGEANTWDSIGYAHHQVGRYPDAIDCYRRSLTLYRELGDRYLEADTLTHLGATHHAAGDRRAADGNWRDALRILDELGHPDAEKLRSRLLGTVGPDGS